MISKSSLAIAVLAFVITAQATGKEIALTFDDAPMGSSKNFGTFNRTQILIEKLKDLNVPSVMVFANPCKRSDSASVIKQLASYKSAGHYIGNHTCSHPRLDTVGFDVYAKDAGNGDSLLSSLFKGQKFFRFPFLNEGTDVKLRDQMRAWLLKNNYRNGMVSVDTDDYIFSFKINQARNSGKKVDFEKVKRLFLGHMLGAVEFYDDLAIKTLGRSPKHVMLLHEMDATVMFIDELVAELRKRGWTIISPVEAYKDPIYAQFPKNTYANNGIVAQLAMEKTGMKMGYFKFEELKAILNQTLGIQSKN